MMKSSKLRFKIEQKSALDSKEYKVHINIKSRKKRIRI